jgi:hypothetical protein
MGYKTAQLVSPWYPKPPHSGAGQPWIVAGGGGRVNVEVVKLWTLTDLALFWKPRTTHRPASGSPHLGLGAAPCCTYLALPRRPLLTSLKFELFLQGAAEL